MPAKSTSSSSTSKRRKTTSKTTRKKTSDKAAKNSAVAVEETDTQDGGDATKLGNLGSGDLDFGEGVIDDEEQASAPKKARKKATKKAAKKRKAEVVVEEAPELQDEIADVDFDDDDDADSRDAVDSREDSAAETDRESEQASGGGDTEGDQQDGGKRRRRRRRRRRGGERQEGSSGQNSSHRSSSQGNRGRSRSNREHQNSGKSRSSGGGGNQRGRSMTKFEKNAPPVEPVPTSGKISGILELHPKGYGFLRAACNDYGARETDAFVSSSFVEKHGLREGILIEGEIGPGSRGQGPRLLTIETIDGKPPEHYEQLKHFDTLTPINPFEQIRLETGPTPLTMRVMDLLCPIGKGQRALIVAPPRSGKTMLLQDIANSVSENHPEIHLIVLLIDERPEEVTEMRRTVKGEVIASSMDQDLESHVRISQLVFERGKRLAESGKDCFILMDSITRTARAFNKWMRGGRDAKIQTGGLDVRAMDIPRKMFGTARRFDEGGSLTVCATALIDTGSRMDEAIFQEFKGTGNMEMVLSRDLADRRIWPAIDISKSGTRREEKILDRDILEGVTMLRRSLISLNPVEAMDQLTRTIAKFDSNKEFLQKIKAVL